MSCSSLYLKTRPISPPINFDLQYMNNTHSPFITRIFIISMAAILPLRLLASLEHLTKYELCLVGAMLILGIPGFATAIASIYVDAQTSVIMSAISVVLLFLMLVFLFFSVKENFRQIRILKRQILPRILDNMKDI